VKQEDKKPVRVMLDEAKEASKERLEEKKPVEVRLGKAG
jgi:hypothetical protein